MDSLDVSLERVGVGEDLVADVAAEKAFAGVDPHVEAQLLALQVLLVAELAFLEMKQTKSSYTPMRRLWHTTL